MRWTHEESYKRSGLVSLIHRRRLSKLLKIFQKIEIVKGGVLADFGCSNGYILSVLQEKFFPNSIYNFYGFDHSNELLELAKVKNLPNTNFHYINLNNIDDRWNNSFNIVLCLETLEHTGNYENALDTLYSSCKNGGTIIISVPNERGIPGIFKFFGRKIIRKNAYENFFENQSEISYLMHLLLNKRIDQFRNPDAVGWGPHLGFDWKVFKNTIVENFLRTNKLELIFTDDNKLRIGYFYVLKKIG